MRASGRRGAGAPPPGAREAGGARRSPPGPAESRLPVERRAVGRARSAVADRLAAAVAQPGCPVCRGLEAEARQDLAAFLREQTMDPAGRAALRAAGGFCSWHTGLLRDAADGILSVAILADDLLTVEPRRRPACPACAALRERAADYLTALLDPATVARVEQGPSLPCRPHLRALRARAPRDPGLRVLEGALAPRLAALRSALAGFIAKQDYRSVAPPTAEEARAWGDALEHLAGRPALFGSDLTRG
jgi:hypothetical protein